NGTYSYTISNVSGYSISNSSGSISVDGKNISVLINFIAHSTIRVYSEYSGFLFNNISLVNTFGVYSEWGSQYPEYVNGSIDGTNFNFNPPAVPGGPWNYSLSIENLPKNSSILAFAHYSNGSVLESAYNFTVISVPSILTNLLMYSGVIHIYTQTKEEWNNSYTINANVDISFKSITGVNIPLPVVGGNYSIIPDVALDFNLSSTGYVTLSGSFAAKTNEIQIGPVNVSAHFSITATGDLQIANDTLHFDSAILSIDVGGTFSVTPSTPLGIDIDGIKLGLTVTFSVSPDIALETILSPTSNSSDEFISGICLMVNSITSRISLPFTVQASLSATSILSGSLGGTLTFNLKLGSGAPLMKGGNITGVVFATVNALMWSYTANLLGPGIIYSWGNTDPSSSLTNAQGQFELSSRYWNVTGYNSEVWINGSFNGTVIHDIYPQTYVSAIQLGSSSYFFYTYDNVSRNITRSLELKGFEMQNQTYSPINIPIQNNSISFSPETISLSNGSVLALWASMPFNESAQNPFNWNYVPIEYSYFNPISATWSPVRNLTNGGVAQSIMGSQYSGKTMIAAIVSPSALSNYSYLKIYDVNGTQIYRLKLQSVASIVSYSAESSIVVLKYINGTYLALNVTSGTNISIPLKQNYTVNQEGLVGNTSSTLFILYRSGTRAILNLYSISNGTVFGNFTLNNTILTLAVDRTNAGYMLVASTTNGINVYDLQSRNDMVLYEHYASTDSVSLGTLINRNGIEIYWLNNYGNATAPLLNLNFVLVPLIPPPVPIISLSYSTHNGSIIAYWSNPHSIAYNTTGYLVEYFNNVVIENLTVSSISSGSHIFSAQLAGTYEFKFVAENLFGSSTAESSITLYTVVFTETGLSSGTAWYVNVTNGNSYLSTTNSLSFLEINGTYSYTIATGNKIYSPSPSSGNFTVNGASVSESITFSLTYTVTFTES
ncbi:MAG: hypothetical protein QW478_14175, partial [Candidatus Micrarchaeaceae archaeon]